MRHAPAAFIRVSGEGADGTFDLRMEDSTGHLTLTPNEGMPSIRVRAAADAWQAEAQRVATALDDDMHTAEQEAMLLTAIEAELLPRTSMVAPAPVPARPALRLLPGGEHAPASRPSRGTHALHLVGTR